MKSIEQINSERHIECKLTAISVTGRNLHQQKSIWCKCICGNIVESAPYTLTSGNTKSCGCLKKLIGNKTGLTIDEINNKKPNGSKLTAISFAMNKQQKSGRQLRTVNAQCDCGEKKVVNVDSFTTGNTLSCGCVFRKMIKDTKTKYKNNVWLIHSKYKGMIGRCYDKKDAAYHYYGGRGVTVCDEWRNDYQKFLDWALNNGYEKGLQLDKDKLGNGLLYSPETCCFLTAKENNQYRRPRTKKDKS